MQKANNKYTFSQRTFINFSDGCEHNHNTAARVQLDSMSRTVALALVRVVLAVDLSVAA